MAAGMSAGSRGLQADTMQAPIKTARTTHRSAAAACVLSSVGRVDCPGSRNQQTCAQCTACEALPPAPATRRCLPASVQGEPHLCLLHCPCWRCMSVLGHQGGHQRVPGALESSPSLSLDACCTGLAAVPALGCWAGAGEGDRVPGVGAPELLSDAGALALQVGNTGEPWHALRSLTVGTLVLL